MRLAFGNNIVTLRGLHIPEDEATASLYATLVEFTAVLGTELAKDVCVAMNE